MLLARYVNGPSHLLEQFETKLLINKSCFGFLDTLPDLGLPKENYTVNFNMFLQYLCLA